MMEFPEGISSFFNVPGFHAAINMRRRLLFLSHLSLRIRLVLQASFMTVL